MDFCQVRERSLKNGVIEVYPDFKVCRSKDLMVRGKSFYAIWDEEKGLWSTDEYDVPRMIDAELYDRASKLNTINNVTVKTMSDFSSRSWMEFRTYITHVSDSSHQLDDKIVFSNTEVKKTDYVSKRLPYPLEKGDISAYDELIGTLYEPEERAKIEWSIGAIISGDSKTIQKFMVLYGEAGAGKSTILNIIQKLFDGYYTTFEAKAITSSNNTFATEAFKTNPLVAIQHDGDLSRIEDNTKLNSIVSHEEIVVNEKYKSAYSSRVNCFLYMGTNKPVKITDAKSGIIRRLIDVRPSGKKVANKRYDELMKQIDFELGGIAYHCLEVYKGMGKNYYANYRPVDMMYKTDPFFNFVEDSFDTFEREDGVTLASAYAMYKLYCDETNADYKLQRYKFREELKNYFGKFEDRAIIDGKPVRSYYSEFITSKFERESKPVKVDEKETDNGYLTLTCTESIFDKECSEFLAQYATRNETPTKPWVDVTSQLKDIDTTKLHYVRLPENHIVIDFDLKDADGNKSKELNLKEASKWPPTYAEFSKGGGGVHLHYIYAGDPSELSRLYADCIEIKVFTGNSSLRRKLSKCNDIPIATISSGLPLKQKKGSKMVNFESARSEKALRNLIMKNLRKEVHPGTKPSIDFIEKILDDAYKSGMKYDVTDMRQDIQAFAAGSTHQSDYCLKACMRMKYKSEEQSEFVNNKEQPIVFYDVEVFPNLFIINWKMEGDESKVVRMINPKPQDVEELMKFRLVGFNCRRYDNHIIYARMMGYSNEELYKLSQRIVNGDSTAFFGEAYNASYTDIYDYAAKKQSLKKWEIELGIHHQELGLPWDQPVPTNMWDKVAEYCDNDVIATEAVWNATVGDFDARRVLAKIAGGSVNDTTNSLTTRLIFQGNRHPQSEFVYTDLSEEFPGYKFENGKSSYKGVDEVGEGGRVYANPGIYVNVKTFDVASMHPHSAIALNLFGDRYTQRFKELVEARIAVKHRDKETLAIIFDGAFAEFVDASDEELKNLAQALKIAINSVYGLTAAKFENPFRDPRNKDNIVAKRGALFMINLTEEVEKRGGVVVHVKTDSIKIADPTPEIEEFVLEYGKQYGYSFEVESEYERICLVNNAVYIAKEKNGEWTATGKQFAVPYVMKTLFTKEPIEFSDLCETFNVSTSLYLDMNEKLEDSGVEKQFHWFNNFGPAITNKWDGTTKRDSKCLVIGDNDSRLRKFEKETGVSRDRLPMTDKEYLDILNEYRAKVKASHDYNFVGKVGQFCPIKPGCGGGLLLREVTPPEDAVYSGYDWAFATGAKDYRWLESETVKNLGKEDDIDLSYYESLVDDAVAAIAQYGDANAFIND